MVKRVAKQPKRIDISHRPEILQLVEQARAANEPLVLQRESEDLAVLRPVKRQRRKQALKGEPTSADDALWKLVGIAESTGPGDVSSNKHKYLPDAYLHRPRGT